MPNTYFRYSIISPFDHKADLSFQGLAKLLMTLNLKVNHQTRNINLIIFEILLENVKNNTKIISVA